jgi:hypothetical protein
MKIKLYLFKIALIHILYQKHFFNVIKVSHVISSKFRLRFNDVYIRGDE